MKERAVCSYCQGPIVRRAKMGTEEWADGPQWHPWLHVYEKDWKDDPHAAEPREADNPAHHVEVKG